MAFGSGKTGALSKIISLCVQCLSGKQVFFFDWGQTGLAYLSRHSIVLLSTWRISVEMTLMRKNSKKSIETCKRHTKTFSDSYGESVIRRILFYSNIILVIGRSTRLKRLSLLNVPPSNVSLMTIVWGESSGWLLRLVPMSKRNESFVENGLCQLFSLYSQSSQVKIITGSIEQLWILYIN